MSVAIAESRRSTGSSWPAIAGLLVLGLATVVASVISNGNVVLAVAPIFAIGILAAMWTLPLQATLFTLILLCLAVDSDFLAVWTSPFVLIGHILINNLNKTLPVSALVVPGMTLVLAFTLLVHLHRVFTASETDNRGECGINPILPLGLAVSSLALGWMIVEGVFKAGSPQMAKIQVQYFVHTLVLGYLLAASLRGTRDYRILGRVLLFAASAKAAMVVWIWYAVPIPIEKLTYRTTHGDSLTFALALVMLVVLYAEQTTWRNAGRLALFAPLILIGMLLNNRRIVWVEVAAALLTYLIISHRSRFKVFVMRTILVLLPVIVAYIAVGWTSKASIFAPVQMFRSVSDGEVDGSTLYRDVENYNLLATIRRGPVIGTGFGHPYYTAVSNADISFFKEFLYLPHNMILGLYGFGGMVGFPGLFGAIMIGIFLATRRYLYEPRALDRVAAMTSIAAIVIYLVHCYGDIGFNEMRSIYTVGPALAIAGQRRLSAIELRQRAARRNG